MEIVTKTAGVPKIASRKETERGVTAANKTTARRRKTTARRNCNVELIRAHHTLKANKAKGCLRATSYQAT
ncbi:MAG TPA: hypothetical protein VGI34_09260 [Candidatus Acidoferrales bacterium]|jgi:hypothetical protein